MIPYAALRKRLEREEIRVKQHVLRPLVAVVLGLALTWSWELILGGISIAGHTLHPGLFGYVALMAMALPMVWHGAAPAWWSAWFLASAVTLAELPLLAARNSQEFDPARLLGAGTLIALVLLLPVAFLRSDRARRVFPSPGWAAGAWALAVLTIGACQGANRWARVHGIANEGRSLILGGIEVHHLNFGVLLLVTAVLLSGIPLSFPWWRGLVLALVGVAVGLIADEWFYYSATEVTDQAYFEPVTWLSALLMSLALLALWFAWVRSDRALPRPLPRA